MTDIKPLNKKFRGQTPGRIPKKITVYAGHIIFKLQKTKDKKKTLKEARGKNHLIYRIRITVDFSEEPCMQEGSEVKSVERKPPTLNSIYSETSSKVKDKLMSLLLLEVVNKRLNDKNKNIRPNVCLTVFSV